MAEECPSILGLGRDRDSAELAYARLLMSDEARNRHFTNDPRRTELGTRATEGVGARAVAVGGLGALSAGLAASGMAVPGLPILAKGTLAAVLTGAVTGGVIGALIGGLIGYGIARARRRLELRTEDGLRPGAQARR
jgi:hypothetical protein